VETVSVCCEAVTPFSNTCYINFVLQKPKTKALKQIKGKPLTQRKKQLGVFCCVKIAKLDFEHKTWPLLLLC